MRFVVGLTCFNLICNENEECSPCGQNSCNTWSCFNPYPGARFQCKFICRNTNPRCICKPRHIRDESGACVPLKCETNTS